MAEPANSAQKNSAANSATVLCPAAKDGITIHPNQCAGRPCTRGMRIRVKEVSDMLADGATQDEILADFPDLEPLGWRPSSRFPPPE